MKRPGCLILNYQLIINDWQLILFFIHYFWITIHWYSIIRMDVTSSDRSTSLSPSPHEGEPGWVWPQFTNEKGHKFDHWRFLPLMRWIANKEKRKGIVKASKFERILICRAYSIYRWRKSLFISSNNDSGRVKTRERIILFKYPDRDFSRVRVSTVA